MRVRGFESHPLRTGFHRIRDGLGTSGPDHLAEFEDDQIVPVKDSAVKSARVIEGAKAIDSPGAPRGLMATHQGPGQRRPADLPPELVAIGWRDGSTDGFGRRRLQSARHEHHYTDR